MERMNKKMKMLVYTTNFKQVEVRGLSFLFSASLIFFDFPDIL